MSKKSVDGTPSKDETKEESKTGKKVKGEQPSDGASKEKDQKADNCSKEEGGKKQKGKEEKTQEGKVSGGKPGKTDEKVKKAEPAEENEKEQKTEQPEQDSAEQESSDMRYMRLMADFQNFRKRVEKEKSDIYLYASEKLALDLLEVMDNFDRALATADANGGAAGDGFVAGMDMIFKQLKGALEKANVLEIEAEGNDFDPNFHNAVMMEASDKYESGKVTAVLQKGYTLNGKVIRPAMVKVSN